MKKIEYYYKNSDVVAYQKIIYDSGYWYEKTYDENGNELTFKNYAGDWNEKTYDNKGNIITFKDSYGLFWVKGKSVTEEEFEVFTKSLLSKITELENQLDELKKLIP